MKVSIIIPTFNSAAFLERAFNSAIKQRGVDCEVIIVDNNSTDGTQTLMERLRAAHPERVRLAYERVQGAAAARNHGVRIAQGEWIQFLDSDDVLLEGKVVRQVELAGTKADWVIGASLQDDENGERILSPVNTEDPWKGLVHDGGIGNTNSNLIRKTLYVSVEGQNEHLANGMDVDLHFRMLCLDPGIVYDTEPGSVYLTREGSRLSTLESYDSRLRSVRLKSRVIEYLSCHRPEYYTGNAGFFRGALVNAIRILATEDIKEASLVMHEHFPYGLRKEDLTSGIIPLFTRHYRLFGFRNVETARLFLTRMLPAGLKQQLKGL